MDYDARDLLQDLARKYGLRFLEQSDHHLGIYNGLFIDASESEGALTLHCGAPGAVLTGDGIADGFPGFTHLGESAVPTEWLERVFDYHENKFDTQSCRLVLGPERLKRLSPDQLLEIPARLALDFHAFGASSAAVTCFQCGDAVATDLIYFDDRCQAVCKDCLGILQRRAPHGRVETEQPVLWSRALPTLLGGTLAFTVLWGLLLQSSDLEMKGLLLLPFLGSVSLTRFVGQAAGGSSLLLRIATGFAILSAITIGILWLLHGLLQQQAPTAWYETVELFVRALPENTAVGYYYLGGLAGLWLGTGWLKRRSTARME